MQSRGEQHTQNVVSQGFVFITKYQLIINNALDIFVIIIDMDVQAFEMKFEERLRKKAFAHYDILSIIADLGRPSEYRVLQERKNTTTGASAASLVGSQHHVLINQAQKDDLVLACPVFRNEIGGEEERIVCLNKLTVTDRRQSAYSSELHKPSFVSGVSVLETPTILSKNTCPYQRNIHNNYVIDYADTGASYYRHYFYGKEHQNWLGQSESYGPLAISIRKEPAHQQQQLSISNNNSNNNNNINNNNNSNNNNNNTNQEPKYHYRIIIRTSELAALRGSVYEDCIPNLANRSNTKEVLEYLLAKSDIQLNKLKLATSNADAQLLKLDEHKLTKTYKVGVLYCKAGQSTEEEFYNNEHSGPLFEEFLSCIGENVRLLGFNKYRGGLDNKSDSTGLYSVYSTYDDCEIMFHVSTMLPYDNNRQQLSRKRHIGNDIVTIVFQEEGALPFTPKTIRSNFQHVFIIVRAINPPQLPDGSYDFSSPRQYAVAVSRSMEMPPFGPPIPQNKTFIKSTQFKNFLLAKIINAENAAHKYCEKFRNMGQRTRLGLLKDLAQDYVTNTNLSDYNGGSNSGASGAAKIVSSLFGGKKRSQRRYANFCGNSDIRGAIVWDVHVKDSGNGNKIIDCILGISSTYLVIIEQETKELVYVTPVEAIMGWTSNPGGIKIYCHQAECLGIQIKDPDVDEVCEIVTRLKAVSNGCESRELTLRRKSCSHNPQNPQNLGFEIQPDGIVTKVESGSIAWQTHLLPGSRIVEICKTSTATLSYSQMKEYIRTSIVVTLTVLPANSDGTSRRGCLSQTCAHQPVISRQHNPSSYSSSLSSWPNKNISHLSRPKRRVPSTSLVTLV